MLLEEKLELINVEWTLSIVKTRVSLKGFFDSCIVLKEVIALLAFYCLPRFILWGSINETLPGHIRLDIGFHRVHSLPSGCSHLFGKPFDGASDSRHLHSLSSVGQGRLSLRFWLLYILTVRKLGFATLSCFVSRPNWPLKTRDSSLTFRWGWSKGLLEFFRVKFACLLFPFSLSRTHICDKPVNHGKFHVISFIELRNWF